jgi:hypothetical protein
MRLTPIFTIAPIMNSLRRMVSTCARVHSVPSRASRRSDFDHRIGHGGEVEAQLIAPHFIGGEPAGEQAFAAANSLMRFSISPRAQ